MGKSTVERKHPPSWDTDRLENLCLSIARNIFSKVNFYRGPGLSYFTTCCPLCLSELGTHVFWNSLILSVACVMTRVPRPQFASEVWVQVTADAGWCKRRRGSLPFAYIPPTFFPSFSFLSTLDSQFSILNFSSPKPGYNMSLHRFFSSPLPNSQ